MVDITKEEFWDSKYEETSRIERKENKESHEYRYRARST